MILECLRLKILDFYPLRELIDSFLSSSLKNIFQQKSIDLSLFGPDQSNSLQRSKNIWNSILLDRSLFGSDRSPTTHSTIHQFRKKILVAANFDSKPSQIVPNLFLAINESLQHILKQEKVLQRFKSSFSQKLHQFT